MSYLLRRIKSYYYCFIKSITNTLKRLYKRHQNHKDFAFYCPDFV